MDKGRLVKVCADLSCTIHFRDQQKEEKQRLQLKAEKTAANRKEKQIISFRHRLMADVLKRLSRSWEPRRCESLRVSCCALSHELVCRLAKRHGLQDPKDANDWQMAEKARTLYKKADGAGLAVLIFEAMLLGSAEKTTDRGMTIH